MKVAHKKGIVIFFRYLKTFGLLNGVFLYFYLRMDQEWSKIPGLTHPVHLRPRTTDLTTFEQIFVSRNYNLKFPFIPSVIIDCGANTGLASIFFASKFPQAKIISIEPESSNFAALQKNTKAYPQISPLKKAIWNNDGNLFIEDVGKGEYAYTVRESTDKGNHNRKIVGEIECITLNTILKQFSLSQIDLLKIDIEGAEREIFKDKLEWLDVTRSIVIEIHDWIQPGSSEVFVKAIATQNNFILGGYKEGMVFMRLDKLGDELKQN